MRLRFNSRFNITSGQLLVIYNLLILGYVFSRGFRSLDELIILVIAFTISLILLFSDKLLLPLGNNTVLLLPLFLTMEISIILSMILYGGLYQEYPYLQNISKLLLISVLLASIAFILNKKSIHKLFTKLNYFYILIAGIVLQFLMIISSPNPHIDAFYILKESIYGLASGQNPYSMHFTQLYPGVPPDYYTYLPGFIYATFLPVILFNDPRVVFIIAQIFSVYFINLILKKYDDNTKEMVSIIFLFNPMTLFILEQSYGELLIPAFIFAFIYFSIKKNNRISSVLLGIFVSLKQIHLTILPFYFFYLGYKLKFIKYTLLTITILLLPFIIWSPYDFFRDNFLIYLNSPNPSAKLSLNIPRMLEEFIKIPVLILVIFSSFIYLILITKLLKANLLKLIYCIYIWFFAIFILGTQAFVNNYYISSSLLLGSIITQLTNNNRDLNKKI